MKSPDILCYGKACDHPPMSGTPALNIKDVRFSYPGQSSEVLKGVTLVIEPGEKVAFVGPNGAGKSTLMNLILGLEPLRHGSISVFGHKAQTCRHRVSMVPQKNSVDWHFPVTVRQVVTMGRYVHLGWFKKPGREDRDAVDRAMEKMEITNIADRQVGELSGGQQQRVMLARTLAHDADLLLLDEPLNHVDIATQELIFHTIEELCQEGKSVLVSTHDLGILTVHFSRALFLDKTIIADGKVKDVLTSENIARAYGFEFHKDKELSPWLNGY
ncbi:ABC transporter ATP-binding protein [Oceanispirochaeta sp.]|jgi:ABC-type Mn2+/Zn2+ transport system ATPase subunit|uniref:metal ABC transporter ATP-binding protein n=1 Tax=Oceanispirochaeta sp. TaxID=2035350 RepID=UPI0026162A1E|nr:ABC transporter ATP-binding protein [Oceanispirochaeta sp.]MDA3957848.1 ABC transporter ATP-binding protein [Oceanispirochaeta sp.]